ncbi:MAG TPA: hypothetical protein DEA32_00970 [Firmicutes bacterium]|nr:hypothetical protein [Bacillota bacterium]
MISRGTIRRDTQGGRIHQLGDKKKASKPNKLRSHKTRSGDTTIRVYFLESVEVNLATNK